MQGVSCKRQTSNCGLFDVTQSHTYWFCGSEAQLTTAIGSQPPKLPPSGRESNEPIEAASIHDWLLRLMLLWLCCRPARCVCRATIDLHAAAFYILLHWLLSSTHAHACLPRVHFLICSHLMLHSVTKMLSNTMCLLSTAKQLYARLRVCIACTCGWKLNSFFAQLANVMYAGTYWKTVLAIEICSTSWHAAAAAAAADCRGMLIMCQHNANLCFSLGKVTHERLP
jgi:hypothetical protein